MLRSIALCLLEKGSKVGLLDQLVGSLSVSSALVTQISMGLTRGLASHITGITLIVLWLLSPLGSQALLRVSSLSLTYNNTELSIPYLNVSAGYNILGDSSDSQSLLVPPNTLMNAVLVGPVSSKKQFTDPWGHVKIPRLSRMPPNASDPNGWRSVRIGSLDDFSSLLGLPLGNFDLLDNQSVTFTVESWYWDLTCDSWTDLTVMTKEQRANAKIPFYQKNSSTSSRGFTYAEPATTIWFNVSGPERRSSRVIEACKIPRNELISSENYTRDIYDCPQLEARTIGVKINEGFTSYFSSCQIATQHVETELFCAKGTCSSNRIRQSLSPHVSRNWTMLDVLADGGQDGWYTLAGLFFGNFANAIAGGMFAGSSDTNALSGYITDPASPLLGSQVCPARNCDALPSLYNVSDAITTSRFNQIMNSYWMTSVGNLLITGTDKTWQDIQNDNVSSSYSGSRRSDSDTLMVVTANADLITPHQKLQCSIRWLIAFTAVSVVSLLSAVSGLVLAVKTRAPRLSMNVSSMLRDNAYSDMCLKGSYLDDSVRSSMRQHMMVRIGDVAPNEPIGHIALSTISNEGTTMVIGRLKRDRLYD